MNSSRVIGIWLTLPRAIVSTIINFAQIRSRRVESIRGFSIFNLSTSIASRCFSPCRYPVLPSFLSQLRHIPNNRFLSCTTRGTSETELSSCIFLMRTSCIDTDSFPRAIARPCAATRKQASTMQLIRDSIIGTTRQAIRAS